MPARPLEPRNHAADREIVALALPALGALAAEPLYVLVDTAIVGHLGTTQLAFKQFFVPQGADPPAVFALSVLFLALGILGSLPGGLLYALAPDQGQTGVKLGSDQGQTPF